MFGAARAASRAAINAVRVSIVPAPTCLADSREILRVLQGFGEVQTYRWLKYDPLSSAPNSALAIYREAESMNALINTCPLTFQVERMQEQDPTPGQPEQEHNPDEEYSTSISHHTKPHTQGEELARTTNSLHTEPTLPNPQPQPRPRELVRKTIQQTYRVTADLWRGSHQGYLERSPFWGPFRVEKRSMIHQDLAKRVPIAGLGDINLKRKEIPVRILLKRQEEVKGQKSLRQIWEEAKELREKQMDG